MGIAFQKEDSLSNRLMQLQKVAYKVADCISDHITISAILVTGSVASGHVDEHSDVDLLVICRDGFPDPQHRKERLELIGHNWSWNCSNDNAIFGQRGDKDGIVDGVQVTICYQTMACIDSVVFDVLTKGATSTRLIPFRPYTLIALLQRSWLLIDKDGHVARWRQQAQEYPLVLQHNILRTFIPVLEEATDDFAITARRRLGVVVLIFHLNYAIDAIMGILYAINAMYDPAEKRAEQYILPTLKKVPLDFLRLLTLILEGPFDPDSAIHRASLLRQLTEDVLQIANACLQEH